MKISMLALRFVAFVFFILSLVTHANENTNESDKSNALVAIQNFVNTGMSIDEALKTVVTDNKQCEDGSCLETVLIAALEVSGETATDDAILAILNAVTAMGMNVDDVTAIAVANAIDPTIASQATAAGSQDVINANQINPLLSTITRPIGAGGGGGDCGVSEPCDN